MKHPWLGFASAVLLVVACASSDPETVADSPAAELDPETLQRIQAELNVAGQLMQQDKFDEALEAASAAVALAPGRVEPYEVLSNW